MDADPGADRGLTRIIAALRAAGFPVADPDQELPLTRCRNCGCDLAAHERCGASRCVNRARCRCPGWRAARE